MMIETKDHSGIETGKTLRLENVISMRRKVTQLEFQSELEKLTEFMTENNIQRTGPMFSTTLGVEEVDGEQLLDMEFLVPVDREVDVPTDYQFKPLFHLVNAVYKQHVGSPERLQNTYDELLNFMQENNLQQITSGYNVTVNEKDVELGELPIIDVYIGVNPSIL